MSRAASAGAPAPQPDLFGPALLPGLTYADEIIGAAEEAEAIRQIEAAGLTPFQFQQWEGKRLTRSFGWTYDFQTGRFARGEAIPAWIEPFRTRAAEFARLDADALEQVLLIDYGVGAGIGWHRDRPVFEHVIGLSLGAPATMRFRRRRAGGFDRASADLAPRSIYHMQGEVRNDWEHSIAPMPGRRWSITFRSLKPAFHQS
ncbi:alpha-ketoglutarate-dependent dioxygenase AlkB [Sphingopyxis sp. SCN 67-31]|uniref:alpha-ketoglutarate-dependent dioxygenase AlkB n=1 Tax=Sphingopyxis sp. SCN 67-31 TaxID=1660142 RepID=UPI000A75119F|nr:alpha-ketoglutarate-dependent dioxygenase AlkB [Sphingopyxis sp. SCN 67-31]KAB2854916.1 MAG: alpha-ketoglutarate-dependent dioxygenase AlkB [Sphingopyxis terrae]MBN8843611.1 alpha-ketoglutarate-dependent dioxygenase AlkB [Sphingomonadales bacterium]